MDTENEVVKLVQERSRKAVEELTAMRDSIDAFLEKIKARDKVLVDEITGHGNVINDALDIKPIMGDAFNKLAARLEGK